MFILKVDMYMLKRVFKQHKVPWVGGLKEMLAQTVFYIAMINFVLIAIVAYNSTLREFILDWIPGFKLWMFLAVLIAFVLTAMVVEYKYIAPSLYSFRSKQMFGHKSEVTDALKRIEAKLNEDGISREESVVAVSGGFDPVHPGHLAYIKEALKLGTHLLVILTRDEQLVEKDRIALTITKENNQIVSAYANALGTTKSSIMECAIEYIRQKHLTDFMVFFSNGYEIKDGRYKDGIKQD